MKNIQGLYPASATPYKEDGSFAPEEFEKLLKKNINEGASGFFIAGSSAECFLLTENERISIFEAASSFKNETVIIAHVGAIGTDEAVRYAKAAKTHGAHYISATLPFYYGFNDLQISEFFYEIANAAQLQVMIYNFPGFTGKKLNLESSDIRALICSNVVCGIKHTDQNLGLLERIGDLNPNISLMNGYDDTMTASLALGADGCVGSMLNVMLPHFMKIYYAYNSGERDFALSLQKKANNIVEAFNNAGLISSIKYVLTKQGINTGPPRKPFKPLTQAQMKYIDEVMERYEIK